MPEKPTNRWKKAFLVVFLVLSTVITALFLLLFSPNIIDRFFNPSHLYGVQVHVEELGVTFVTKRYHSFGLSPISVLATGGENNVRTGPYGGITRIRDYLLSISNSEKLVLRDGGMNGEMLVTFSIEDRTKLPERVKHSYVGLLEWDGRHSRINEYLEIPGTKDAYAKQLKFAGGHYTLIYNELNEVGPFEFNFTLEDGVLEKI